MTESPDLETVVGLMDDDYARAILRETSVEALSAGELADRCDASRQTVYRRLDSLQEAGLVTEQTRPREDGHHDAVYAATLDRLSIELREGTFEFELEQSESNAADELTRLWRHF